MLKQIVLMSQVVVFSKENIGSSIRDIIPDLFTIFTARKCPK